MKQNKLKETEIMQRERKNVLNQCHKNRVHKKKKHWENKNVLEIKTMIVDKKT